MIQEQKAHRIKLQKYYKVHSSIYDATRWSFLFGRESFLYGLPELKPCPRILEVGCGTGKNLQLLQYLYPDATITGIDLSEDMLQKARQKVGAAEELKLMQYCYGSKHPGWEPFDLVVLSYSLTMIGENINKVLQQVHEDLNHKGYVAVVDFHNTPFNWFRRWMAHNHVTMDGSIFPLLRKYFTVEKASIHNAYLGFWKYFTFHGKRS